MLQQVSFLIRLPIHLFIQSIFTKYYVPGSGSVVEAISLIIILLMQVVNIYYHY